MQGPVGGEDLGFYPGEGGSLEGRGPRRDLTRALTGALWWRLRGGHAERARAEDCAGWWSRGAMTRQEGREQWRLLDGLKVEPSTLAGGRALRPLWALPECPR